MTFLKHNAKYVKNVEKKGPGWISSVFLPSLSGDTIAYNFLVYYPSLQTGNPEKFVLPIAAFPYSFII